MIKGLFTKYIDKILEFFEYLPPCIDIYYGMNIDKPSWCEKPNTQITSTQYSLIAKMQWRYQLLKRGATLESRAIHIKKIQYNQLWGH